MTTLEEFNVEEALNGASIGFSLGKDEKDNYIIEYIIDFKFSDTGKTKSEYVGISQKTNKKYYFNRKGECEDRDDNHQLHRVVDEIKFTEGTAGSRGEVDEEGNEITVPIESMQPREQFAMAAMKSIIGKIEGNILGIDDYKITKIGELSFKLAQVMMTLSAKFRELAKEEVESPYIEIDKEALTDDTNKILYNIQTVLKG